MRELAFNGARLSLPGGDHDPLITSDGHGKSADELTEMYRVRYRLFKERLVRNVQVSGSMETDKFDAFHPDCLLQRGTDRQIPGCLRRFSLTVAIMLSDSLRPAVWATRAGKLHHLGEQSAVGRSCSQRAQSGKRARSSHFRALCRREVPKPRALGARGARCGVNGRPHKEQVWLHCPIGTKS